MLGHSVDDYLADVDTNTAAAAFRAQERTDITDLADVPLASWAYVQPEQVNDNGLIAAATKRYGAAALILNVRLRYALKYVDPLPTEHTLYLTFVRRDDHVVLSGDDDLAEMDTRSWVGPWRFGPLSAQRGTTCLVLGPASAPLSDVAAAVDAAVPQVAAVWGTDWNRDVTVIVTSSTAAFDADVGTVEHLQDVSAAAVTDGVDPISHRAYGQRLVLAPNTLATLSSVGEQIVLRHEISHLATAAITDSTTPRWVVEGFAEYVANLGTGQPVAVAASELRAAVHAGQLPTALPSDSAFGETSSALARAYEEAWLACRLIAARAGTAGLVQFYKTAAAALLPASAALAKGLEDAVHESLSQFTAQWRTYLKTELS